MLVVFSGMAMPAWAADSPAPLIGRVSAVTGGAATRTAAGDWADSLVNDPIAAGMSVRTTAQGTARLRVGADTVALAPDSNIDVPQVNTSGVQIVLHQGRVGVRLSAADPTHTIEIDTPRGGVWLLVPGDYDVSAGDQKTPSRVAVLDGSARIVGKGLDKTVATGDAAMLSGTDPVVATAAVASPDDFTAWWRPAAGNQADAQVLHHLPVAMTGYDALDGNGSWDTVSGYGAVWFPNNLPQNWAPYRFGHWHWVAPWGWTWVDDMDWGFAPSHYGRWALLPGPDGVTERWGWVPGKSVDHPAYMPAAVAFLGTAGIGLSYPDASGPAVGWFPLAPGEAYWPTYTRDIAAIRQLDEGSVADPSALVPAPDGGPPAALVDGKYRNRLYASVVPRPVFVGGKAVASALVQLPAQRLENAPLLAGSPQIAPAAPPHPVIVAAAPPPAKPEAAIRTLARILARPHGRMAVAARWRVERLARSHIVHAVLARGVSRRPLRFAAFRRRR